MGPYHREHQRTIDLAILIHRHLQKVRSGAAPISIQAQVDALRERIPPSTVADNDLVREIERCAIECGLPVRFDATVRPPREAASADSPSR
jgi:hypothetical protein